MALRLAIFIIYLVTAVVNGECITVRGVCFVESACMDINPAHSPIMTSFSANRKANRNLQMCVPRLRKLHTQL